MPYTSDFVSYLSNLGKPSNVSNMSIGPSTSATTPTFQTEVTKPPASSDAATKSKVSDIPKYAGSGVNKAGRKAVKAAATTENESVVRESFETKMSKNKEYNAEIKPIDPKLGVPADYYRNGGPFNKIIKQTVEVEDPAAKSYKGESQSRTVNVEAGYYQSPMPRTLTEPKEESVATIRMMGRPNRKADKDLIDLVPAYSKFFVERASEAHVERSQIIETFGEFYVFFHGERPPIYNFSGILLNDADLNWVTDFYFYYDKFLRGTKCVEAGAKLVMTYGFRQIEGFILNLSMDINAMNEKGVPFSFQMVVTSRVNATPSSLDFGVIKLQHGEFTLDETITQMLSTGMSDPNNSYARKRTEEVIANNERAARIAENKRQVQQYKADRDKRRAAEKDLQERRETMIKDYGVKDSDIVVDKSTGELSLTPEAQAQQKLKAKQSTVYDFSMYGA